MWCFGLFYDRCYSLSIWIWVSLILNLCLYQKGLSILDFVHSALSWMKWRLLSWLQNLEENWYWDMGRLQGPLMLEIPGLPWGHKRGHQAQGGQQDPGPTLSQWKVREPQTSMTIKKKESQGKDVVTLDSRNLTRNLNTRELVGWINLISLLIGAGTETELWRA